MDPQPSTLNPSIFLQMQEEERQRLAHALMDGPGQVLANALMEIEYSLPLLQTNPSVALAGLHALRNELRMGLAQIKDYVAELQPPFLDEMGLGPSLSAYVRTFAARTGIRAACDGCDQFHERYPATIEIALFRILQEALANVELHAQASAVEVAISRTLTRVSLSIRDNGRGFAPDAHGMPKKRQLGIIAMRDRAELLGGQMQLFTESGRGVRVVVTIPYHGHLVNTTPEGGPDNHEHAHQPLARPRDAQGSAHHKNSVRRKPIR